MNTVFMILFIIAVIAVFSLVINRIDAQSKIIKAHGMMIDSIMRSMNQEQQGFIGKIKIDKEKDLNVAPFKRYKSIKEGLKPSEVESKPVKKVIKSKTKTKK